MRLVWWIVLGFSLQLSSVLSKHKEVTSRAFSFRFNKDFVNMTVDGSNKTHLGALRVWNLKKLPALRGRIELKSGQTNKIFFDHTLLLCNLKKQRRLNLYLRLFFDMNVNNFSFELNDLKCPIEPGLYELKARPRALDSRVFFPSFISTDERVIFTVEILTRNNGLDEKIFYTTESYELKEFDD